MGLTDDNHGEVYQFLGELEAGVERAAPAGISSGSMGYGASGPMWLDDYRTKRPPTKVEMIDKFKSVAFSCVNLNANAVAKVPLRLYARTGRGQDRPRFWETRSIEGRERKTLINRLCGNATTKGFVSGDDQIEEITDCEHPLLKTLARPNPYFDGHGLIQHLARSLDVLGEAHWLPVRAGEGFAPHEIWGMHSQYCFPVKGTGDRVIDKWLYFADEYPYEALIWFRFTSLRDPYMGGYGPLHACYEQLGLIGYYVATVESILKNGARPEGIIGPKSADEPWNEVQRKRMELRMNSGFGRDKNGRILVADGSFDFKPLTFAPTDLGGKELSREARLVVANCFDVPISMLEAEDSNKATASEGSVQHQRNAVEPRCTLIAAAMTINLAWPLNPRLFFAFDNPVQQDKKVNADVHQIYLKNQVLVPNEVRAEIGYEPRKGGDEPLAQPKPGDGPKPKEEDDE